MKSLNLPVWLTLNNILAEVCDLKIFIQIEDSLGGLKGFEPQHDGSNLVKLLVNLKPDLYHQEFIKIITNTSLYKINFSLYQGDIKHILFLKDNRKVAANISNFKHMKMETILVK